MGKSLHRKDPSGQEERGRGGQGGGAQRSLDITPRALTSHYRMCGREFVMATILTEITVNTGRV